VLRFSLALAEKFGEVLKGLGEKGKLVDPKGQGGEGALVKFLVTIIQKALCIIQNLFDPSLTWKTAIRSWEFKFPPNPNESLLFGNIKALTQSMTTVVTLLRACNASLASGGSLSAELYQLRADALYSLGSIIYSNQLAQNKLDSGSIGGLVALGDTIGWPQPLLRQTQSNNPQ